MVLVATRRATEDRLRDARMGVHPSASRARLRRVRGGHFNERAAVPGKLVTQLLDELTPARAEDTSSKSTVRSNHIADVKLLNDDRTVALGVADAELVNKVVALTAYLAVQTPNAKAGFLSVLRPFLSARDGSLSTSQAFQRGFEVARVIDPAPIRVGHEGHNAAVNGYGGQRGRCGGGDFELADHRGEPLIAFAHERTRLWRPFERSMHHRSKVSELREAKPRPVQTPRLGVRLAKAEGIAPSSLPARSAREFFEAALPGLVEFDQKLRADVSRHVRKPGELGTQRRQLVDLVEGGWNASLVAWAGKAQKALLKSEVPKKPQGVLPSRQASLLRLGRVDAVSKRLADKHAVDPSLVYVSCK